MGLLVPPNSGCVTVWSSQAKLKPARPGAGKGAWVPCGPVPLGSSSVLIRHPIFHLSEVCCFLNADILLVLMIDTLDLCVAESSCSSAR